MGVSLVRRADLSITTPFYRKTLESFPDDADVSAMRFCARVVLVSAVVASGCGGGEGNNVAPGAGGKAASNTPLTIPKIYPPIRSATPNGLVAGSPFARTITRAPGAAARTATLLALPAPAFTVTQAAVNLAQVVKERLYTAGPTELLRIVKELDDRTAGLDTRPAQHPCLTTTPIDKTYDLAGGPPFPVKLQCLQSLGEQWLAFGFAQALDAPDGGADDAGSDGSDAGRGDGGALATPGGGDAFYLVEGMTGGMGGAYRVDRASGNLEGWIVVADRRAPSNSQVVMHLLTDKAAGTLELSFGGTGVGFCAAHLKTGAGHIFVSGKTNAPPPPGTAMSPGLQSCDVERAGCFDAAALATDLGAEAPSCAPLAASTFVLHPGLDASTEPGANVTPSALSIHFESAPAGVPAF